MKKYFLKAIYTFIFAALFTSTFAGCQFIDWSESEKYPNQKPTVKPGLNGGNVISFKYKSSDTDYIYICRKTVLEDEQGNDKSKTEWIGILNQDAFSTSSTFIFQDAYVTADQKYQYQTVYHDRELEEKGLNSYFYSNWSDTVTPSGGTGPLTYSKSTVPDTITYAGNPGYSLTCNKDFSELTFADANNTETGYSPCLLISNGTATNCFPLPASTTTYINLREVVSSGYVDTPITIQGLLGQKVEYLKDEEGNDSETIAYIYYTSVSALSITMPSNIDEIKIVSSQGTGTFIPENK